MRTLPAAQVKTQGLRTSVVVVGGMEVGQLPVGQLPAVAVPRSEGSLPTLRPLPGPPLASPLDAQNPTGADVQFAACTALRRVESVDGLLPKIFELLVPDPQDVAHASAVNRTWWCVGSSEALWKMICDQNAARFPLIKVLKARTGCNQTWRKLFGQRVGNHHKLVEGSACTFRRGDTLHVNVFLLRLRDSKIMQLMHQVGCEDAFDLFGYDHPLCSSAMSSVSSSGGVYLHIDIQTKPIEHCVGRGSPVSSFQDDRWRCPCGHSAECDDVMCAVSKWRVCLEDDEDVFGIDDMLLIGLDSDLWV